MKIAPNWKNCIVQVVDNSLTVGPKGQIPLTTLKINVLNVAVHGL